MSKGKRELIDFGIDAGGKVFDFHFFLARRHNRGTGVYQRRP